MSKCYQCGNQWTNENKIETEQRCPECRSLAAMPGSAGASAIDELDEWRSAGRRRMVCAATPRHLTWT